jgi:hypothetical protein
MIISADVSEESYITTSYFPIKLVSQLECLKAMFMFAAFVFDIYKWCIFIIATRSYNLYNSRSFITQKKKLQWAIAILQILNLVISLSFVITMLLLDIESP